MGEIKKINLNISDLKQSEKEIKDKKEDFTKLTEALNGGLVQGGDTIQIYSYRHDGMKMTTVNENEQIAGKLHEQINGISLKNNTIKELKKITPENVLDVINEYDKMSPQKSLVDALFSEWGMDRNSIKTYLLKPLTEQAQKLGVENLSDLNSLNSNAEIKETAGRLIKQLNAIQRTSNAQRTEETQDSADSEQPFPDELNPNDYTVESLRKKYPPDKYLVQESSYEGLTVRDKTTQKLVLKVHKDSKGTYITKYNEKGKEESFANYDENNQLRFYDVKGKRHFPIADKLYDDIYARNAMGLPTTGKDIDKHISMITPENVLDVMSAYAKKSGGQGLIDAIMKEYGLPAQKRAELVSHITNAYIEYAKSKGVYTDDIQDRITQNINYERRKVGPMNGKNIEENLELLDVRITKSSFSQEKIAPNGKIDADFAQGGVGDCWLLGAIKAAANHPEASKMLDDLVSVDANGNVIVELKGPGKKYIITQEELYGSNELATGDMDARAIEIAVNKYFHDEYEHSWDPHKRNDIGEGGQSAMAFEVLFGKGGKNYVDESIYGNIYDILFTVNNSLIEKIKKGKAIAVASVTSMLKFTPLKEGVNENGESVSITENHAYSVVDADDKYVYLVNPWDTSKVIKMTHEDFKDTFNSVDVLDME